MTETAPPPPAALSRLSVMMFLQFFAWGAWFATLSLAMGSNDLGAFVGGAFESAPIGAIFAPLFLGLIADRFFPSDKVMGVLLVIGGVLMCLVPGMGEKTQSLYQPVAALTEQLEQTPEGEAVLAVNAEADVRVTLSESDEDLSASTQETLDEAQSAYAEYAASGGTIVWVLIAYMLCYMPTLGLANSVVFTHLPQELFPKARVWGTIGWIVSGLGVGIAGWSASLNIFWVAAVSSLLLGLYCFTLPNTPAPAKGTPLNLGALLMLDAVKLLKSPSFAVFAICSFLICIPLAYYYGQTSAFLGAAGYEQAASTMTLGQMSEIIFMILIPFFFRKLGVKWMLMIGMACWVVRYVLFAMGAPDQIAWMLLLGVALHGVCYDFFFVTGFIYTDKKAPPAIRGQAQSLLVFLTQGLGMFVGLRMAFGGSFPFGGPAIPNTATVGDTTYGTPPSDDLLGAIKDANADAEAPSYLEKMLSMFSKGYPEGIDQKLIDRTMEQWTEYWMFPAGMAAVVLVIFAITFWDRVKRDDVDQIEAAEALPEDAPA